MIPWMWKSGMTSSERSAAVSCERRGDVAGRAGQVALAQRHDLRPRRRARRVQHERFVVGARRTVGRRRARDWSRAATRSTARPRRARRRRSSRRARPTRAPVLAPSRHERGGVEVVEVEPELLFAVLRVQRRGTADRHRGQQHQRHLRPVGQDDGDPVAGSQPGRAQSPGQPIDRGPQGGMIDRLAVDGHQRRPRVRAAAARRPRCRPGPRDGWWGWSRSSP